MDVEVTARGQVPEHTRRLAEDELVLAGHAVRARAAAGSMDAAVDELGEVAPEMDALDHVFYLYRDVATGSDAPLYRGDDGHLAVIDPPGAAGVVQGGPPRERSRLARPVDLRTAVREMDELGHRFLFFANEQTRRGNVIYLRFDGQYGLIEPLE